eukprot:5082820-Pyramimonas_sp.AAC.1
MQREDDLLVEGRTSGLRTPFPQDPSPSCQWAPDVHTTGISCGGTRQISEVRTVAFAVYPQKAHLIATTLPGQTLSRSSWPQGGAHIDLLASATR